MSMAKKAKLLGNIVMLSKIPETELKCFNITT